MNLRCRHPIIALWVHPRSMSTAIERIMRERGDLDCLHEPFMYYYYLGLDKKVFPHSRLDPARPTGFDDIVSDLYRRAAASPVFFKDMGFYVVPEIFRHPELAGDIRHLILIRNPRRSILSYHRLDPDLTLEEAGIEAQWRLFEWLSCQGRGRPWIIEAERVQHDPAGTLAAAWKHAGLAFTEQAFRWQADIVPDDWKSVAKWHREVIQSTGIHPAPEDEEALEARFGEAARESPVLNRLLQYHLPFYERLVAASRAQEAE